MNHLSIKKLLFLFILACPGLVFALGGASLVGQEDQDFDNLNAVDNIVLDSMRGGYVVEGIKIDIGLQKVVYADGILQSQSSLDNIGILNLNGNTVSARDLQNITSNLNTIVQNQLDNKAIQALTVIDVGVKNVGSIQNGFLEAMRGLQDIQTGR